MRQGTAFRYVLLLSVAPFTGLAADRPFPDPVRGDIPLEKTALQISYNPEHKQANWVFYELGREQLRNCVQRNNNFKQDPELDDRDAATLADYKNSGYDRGHLSPAADNKFSPAAMSESFLLSNISPQPPRFNQGIWGRLENLVRAWALKKGGLWVTTGPVLQRGLPTIGDNEVSTPRAYYKVLVSQKTKESLAILMPITATGDIAQYAVPTSVVEQQSHLNFHTGLSESEERELESIVAPETWDFRATYKTPPCKSKGSFEPFSFDSETGWAFFQN
jgi:endonuclease G, mitochondrial